MHVIIMHMFTRFVLFDLYNVHLSVALYAFTSEENLSLVGVMKMISTVGHAVPNYWFCVH